MGYTIKPNYDTNRKELGKVLPVDTPYTVFIEITRTCNFKCYYCMHSTKGIPGGEFEKNKLIVDHMPFELFKDISKQICAMNPQPKRVLLLGLGEPFMYPYIIEGIKQLRKDGYLGRLDMITNASLIDKAMADKLVSSGLSKLIISLQGMDEITYKEVCGYKINFDEFVQNLKYLYENRGDMHIYIKIMDNMLHSEEDKKSFFEIFGSISDTCNIEHLVVNQVQMGDHDGKVDHLLNIHSDEILPMEICSKPFYQIQIYPDGDVLACPISGAPKVFTIGNVYEESLMEIWNGSRRRNVLEKFLRDRKLAYGPCEICESIHCVSRPEEIIDNHVDEIRERMEKYYGIRN